MKRGNDKEKIYIAILAAILLTVPISSIGSAAEPASVISEQTDRRWSPSAKAQDSGRNPVHAELVDGFTQTLLMWLVDMKQFGLLGVTEDDALFIVIARRFCPCLAQDICQKLLTY